MNYYFVILHKSPPLLMEPVEVIIVKSIIRDYAVDDAVGFIWRPLE